ncbi:hypothetical protein QZH56_36740 [Streptomyces olivoreticuli]|uniref:hypothetical protein n=1 Tax=Streptomyces olivoreticuli TaxID=68246 RepID=UPI00265B6889|nr:hypothetical protein [Streptomyces olivoreticuli]WKK24126.1 hypothetical protein QZH56_36740 [Streptomyces olivoreticuli]
MPKDTGTTPVITFNYRHDVIAVPATIDGVRDWLSEHLREEFTTVTENTPPGDFDELFMDWVTEAAKDDPVVAEAIGRIKAGGLSGNVTYEETA